MAPRTSRAPWSLRAAVVMAVVVVVAVAVAPVQANAQKDSGSVTVVDVRNATVAGSPAMLTAVWAAAGLSNRAGERVYVVADDTDVFWFQEVVQPAKLKREDQTPKAFLSAALSRFGGVLFDSGDKQVLPAVVTLAGVLGAVPMDARLFSAFPNTSVVLDSTVLGWQSQEDAVQWTAKFHLNATTSLALQQPDNLANGLLVDWIVQERIFTLYLPEHMCVPFTRDHEILKGIVDASPWPRPVRVYGYNSQDPVFGGDLFEAETDCIDVLGQVATAHAKNLAFLSGLERLAPAETMPPQPAPSPVAYDKDKTYVALVYGDMDNLDIVLTFGSQHMQYRAARCANASTTPAARGACFPLTWTLSPNLAYLGPSVMRWFYRKAAESNGADWFMMPPSGSLYSYPGEFPADVQDLYVKDMHYYATVMNTSATIHWEWVLTWKAAWDGYFPRFLNASFAGQPHNVRAFFLNNVPWPIPIPDMFLRRETYRFVGDPQDPGSVVGFKPAFNWQEGGNGGNPGNATVIAGKLNALPRGSVQYMYTIQNTDIEHVFDMVDQLDSHVVLVGYEQLVSLARQREAALNA